jgi:hypothetical protein
MPDPIQVVSQIVLSGLSGSSFFDILFATWTIDDPNEDGLDYLKYDHTDIYATPWVTSGTPGNFRDAHFIGRSLGDSIICRFSGLPLTAGLKSRFWAIPYNKSGGAGSPPVDGFDVDISAGYSVSNAVFFNPTYAQITVVSPVGQPSATMVGGPLVLAAKQTTQNNSSQLSFPAMSGTPSRLSDGDIWFDGGSNKLKMRVNGTTKTFAFE